MDSLAEALGAASLPDPALGKNVGEIVEKTKKAKPTEKLSKKKKKATIDEVD